ncbi:MAG: SGNH/GDSL hydrolase family protein [Clostridiales bacterium]|jgi:lysophospholipase L1-like esterase|nr:SGNH/GDSL hydrolase family protein [Clostridiales bacterium]
MELKKGDVILFNGDSITDCGRDKNDFHSVSGYNKIVAAALAAFCPEKQIEVFNRGVNGDRTRELLARIKNEVAEVKPTVISLLIGVNNVWRGFGENSETPAAAFQKEYRAVLDICKKAADRIVIIEPFIIPSTPDAVGVRPQLDIASTVIRALAAEYKTEFIPADGIFAELAVKNGAALYSPDGVHLTDAGNVVLAREWLKRVDG